MVYLLNIYDTLIALFNYPRKNRALRQKTKKVFN